MASFLKYMIEVIYRAMKRIVISFLFFSTTRKATPIASAFRTIDKLLRLQARPIRLGPDDFVICHSIDPRSSRSGESRVTIPKRFVR
jgi:hypothetical protein